MKRTKPLAKLARTNKKTNGSSVHLTNGNGNGNGNGKRLTDKQRAFVQEYLIDLNATQAAIRANYSKESAAVMGCQNLQKPAIQQAIQEEIDRRAERTHLSQDKVVKELARIAFTNMRSFVRWNSKSVMIEDSNNLSEDDTAAIAEIVQQPTQYGTTIKVKLHDKKAALELLGKHLGMFSDTVKHVGKDGGPVEHKFNFSDKAIKAAYNQLYGKESNSK